MKLVLKILLFGGIILGVAYTVYYLATKDEEEPIVYTFEQAKVQDVYKKTVATGSVVPRKEVEIKPQVSGIIRELYVEAGDKVTTGDLIAKVQIIPNMVTLNNAENRVKRAEIAFNQAEIDYNRNKLLNDQGVLADAAFLPFDIALQSAKEELEAAESNLTLIKEGTSRRSGSSTNTLIRSTIDGMILDVPVKEGNSVIESNTFNEGTTIASVADMGNMIFEGNVDESEVGKIRAGMDLILNIGAIEGASYDAKLEYISPKGKEVDGAIQFEIRAALNVADSGNFIRAGYSANADIVLDKREQVVTINEGLLQFEGDKTFVEVETGEQQYEKRYVELGLSDGQNIEVVSGLDTTDRIKNPNPYIGGGEGGHGGGH